MSKQLVGGTFVVNRYETKARMPYSTYCIVHILEPSVVSTNNLIPDRVTCMYRKNRLYLPT